MAHSRVSVELWPPGGRPARGDVSRLSPEARKTHIQLKRSARGSCLALRLFGLLGLRLTVEARPHGGPPALLRPPMQVSVSARDTHMWSDGPAKMTHKITITVRVGHTRFLRTWAEGRAPPLGRCGWYCCERGLHGLVGVCLNFFWAYTCEWNLGLLGVLG